MADTIVAMTGSNGSTGRDLLRAIGDAVLSGRRALGWGQRELGKRCGLAQSTISAIERAASADLPLATAVTALEMVGIEVELVLRRPHLAASARQRDYAHAACVASVRRRLERAGWLVATEVEVVSGRSRGAIDVLAYHPREHVMLVIEIKTVIHDVGEIDRQIAWYTRESWEAARQLMWRPRAVTGCLLLLATADNDERLVANKASFVHGYTLRAPELARLIQAPADPPRRGLRALAMIDPAFKGIEWLRRTGLDGRRSLAPYEDYADFMARRGARRRRAA